MERLFLLSPARCGGPRALLLSRPGASSPLALRLRAGELTVGETFSFLSGLYFRGKAAYARRFAAPPAGSAGALVITPSRGLVPLDELLPLSRFRAFGRVDISEDDPRYLRPLLRGAEALAAAAPTAELVLLGSIATAKYVEPLLRVFGERLLFPEAFVGRGDMSRGGLMLRASRSGEELSYVPVAGAVRTGRRPPKLPRRPQAA